MSCFKTFEKYFIQIEQIGNCMILNRTCQVWFRWSSSKF